MAKFLNTVLNNVILALETEYNVYEVFDAEDANVVLNDVQEANFPVAFFNIKNSGSVTLTRHKKSYPVYDVSIWLLNLYEEDDKGELKTNYEGLRLDSLELLQRFQRTTAFARVPTNTVLTPRIEEFDAQLDLLSSALQITFSASIDIEEDTGRVCAPLSISMISIDDSDLDGVVLDASASSYRGTASGSTTGTHNWTFLMNGTGINISGLATDFLSSADISILETIGMGNASGTYNSFTFDKNTERTPEFNFVISVSHTYDFRSNGEASPSTTGQVAKRILFSFKTTWNTSVDGVFNPVMVGGEKEWVFGSEVISGDSPFYNGNFLDGTEKFVIVESPDFSSITDVDFADLKVTGSLDLSLFEGSPSLALTACPFSQIIPPSNPVSGITLTEFEGTEILLPINGSVNIDDCDNLITVHITSGTTTEQRLTNCSALEDFTHSGIMNGLMALNGSESVLSINISNGETGEGMNFRCVLEAFKLNNYEINNFTSFRFADTTTTQEDLDNAWIEIDRVALITDMSKPATERTLDGSRPTASPSALSQEARDSLASKNYILLL